MRHEPVQLLMPQRWRGAAGGEPAARDLAERNGAELLSFEHTWRCVRVDVRVGDVQVQAEASASTVWVRSSG